MRKNFLLVFLLGLLPLASWADKPTGGTAPTLATGTMTYEPGVKHTLVATPAGTPTGYDTSYGKVKYIALKNESSRPLPTREGWSTELPQVEEAGTWYVWYFITSDGTYQYDEDGDVLAVGTGSVVVNPKALSAGTAADQYTAPAAFSPLHKFTNANQDIVSAGTVDASIGKFEYRYKRSNQGSSSWSAWSEDVPQVLNRLSGTTTYQVQYRIAVKSDNKNYVWTSGTPQIETNLARATWTLGDALGGDVNLVAPKSADNVFNGDLQDILIPGENSLGATIQYYAGNNPGSIFATWYNSLNYDDLRERNVSNNANGYTRYYRIEQGTNWEAFSYQAVNGKILPADAPAATGGKLADSPIAYDAKAHQLITTGYNAPISGSGSATVRYYVNGVERGTNINNITETEFGEYEISYDIVYGGTALRNYKPVADPKPVLGTVKIDKVILTAAATSYTKDFDDQAFEDTQDNRKLLVSATGWLGTETDEQKADILSQLITVTKGLPQINVGGYKVGLKSQEVDKISYKIDPLFVAETDLTILKVNNYWEKPEDDVSITATWSYGATPAVPTCKPALLKKEDGENAEITYKYYSDAACTTEVPAPTTTTAVGTYYVKAFVEGCNNFFPLESTTPASFEITQTPHEFIAPLTIADWEYLQGPNLPSTEVDDGATITYTYFKDAGMLEPMDAPTATLGVGTYYVLATAAETKNHTELTLGPKEFKVTPTTLPDLAFTYDEVPYIEGGANQIPEIAEVQALITEVIPADYDVTFTDAEGNATSEFINVGTYYVVITGKGNYAKETETGSGIINFQKKAFVIEPIDPIITPTKKINLTYTATDLDLVEPAVSADGEFWYAEGETAPAWNDADPKHEGWTKDVPTGFNAGKYTVYTKFVPDGNHNAATVADVDDAEILPAQLKITLTNTLEKPWDGIEFSPEQVEETYVIDGLLGDDVYVIPFTLTLPTTKENNFIDAKEYELKKLNITWTDENVQNYKIAFTTIGSVTINKANIVAADFEAPEGDPDLKYEVGIVHPLLKKAGVMINNYGKFLYAIEDEEGKIGEYAEYDPEKPAPLVGEDAGDYVIWYYIEGDDNHNSTDPEKIEVTIAQATLTADLLPEKFENSKPYNGKAQTFTIVLDEDFVEEGVDYKVTPSTTEMKNAGEYALTFEGIGNWTGSFDVPVYITKLKTQATAKSISKVYDGVAGIDPAKIEFTYPSLIPGEEEDAIVAGAGAVYFETVSANVGGYPMLFDTEKFVSTNYEVIEVENTGAELTIEKRDLIVDWNDAAAGFTKVYGQDDPDLVATVANLVIDNAVEGEEAAIANETVITRADGEAVGKYGIELSAKPKAKPTDASVFDNYNVSFGDAADVFEITQADIIIALAPQEQNFDGNAATIEVTADKLVITNLTGGDIKADDIFTTLPTATINGGKDAINKGEYVVTLDGAVAADYAISYLPSTLTINPVFVNAKFNNKPVVAVGTTKAEVEANVEWTVEADDAADQATVDKFMGLFELAIADDIFDANDKIAKGANGKNALEIVYKNEATDGNFEFLAATGDLSIGGAGSEIALDDSAPVVTFASEPGSIVTFTQSRAVTADKWQACVLPCTISIEDFSNAFGYAAVDLFDKSRTNTEEIHFSLQVTGNIEAGVPFLFKANKDINFQDLELKNAEVANTADLNTVVEDDDTDIKFIGTFEGVNLTTAGYRYISKGSWYATKDGQAKPYVIKPLRAYLDLGTQFTGARIFIEEPDGTVTAIDTITLEGNNAEGLYNLNGMKVNQGLKGVYIQNGKKVIKK